MKERVRFLVIIYGVLLTAGGSAALKPTRPKFKIATSSTTTTTTTTTTEEPEPEEPEVTTVQIDGNATTGHTLTGIPQIDYIWDPNLPRELNGYNLSSYPFYSTVPTEEITFKCDGLHDGFYASIEHKCQVYHHCLYGTRYDFLCANFTAFDQKTFICHFASEVDCANSKKYWHRNDALYQATTTTTTSTTTTTTLAPPTTSTLSPSQLPGSQGRPRDRDRDSNPRRRPFRRRPAYDYYDDEYYDEEYDRTRPRGYDRRDSYEYDDRNYRTDVQRDRDRDRNRDRDYRDHGPRHRERERERERDNQRPGVYDERDKIPAGIRPGRRDRRPLDQFDDDTRPLVRDRTRDPETGKSPVNEERRKESPDVIRARDSARDGTDDRRYSDKRYRNDYDEKDQSTVVTGANDGLVKPAAPISSVYARPRAPPKIRRPVPVSEQEKYAYNVSSAPTIIAVTEETRRRPDPVDDDYLEDDPEDARPRRPNRRRPAYRDKEANYDPRENRERERDRDRNYRTRYQDENEDEVQPRKRPDRQRDRHYERGGDRPRGYDRDRPNVDPGGAVSSGITERPVVQYPSRSAGERVSGLLNSRPLNREEDFNRQKFAVREREPIATLQSDAPKKLNYYHQRTEKTFAEDPPAALESFKNQDDRRDDLDLERDEKTSKFSQLDLIPESQPPSLIKSTSLGASRGKQKYEETTDSEDTSGSDYRSESSSEYYDEPAEELPPSSPRTTLRIVKRPFLPSRGGNPNPRGLKQVGSRFEHKSEEVLTGGPPSRINPANEDAPEISEDRNYRRQPYDAYKTIQSDDTRQPQEPIDIGVAARPQSRRLQKEDSPIVLQSSSNDQTRESPQRDRSIPIIVNGQENNYDGVLKPNQVPHRLQDIPESEYDVTLNDALTPTLSQESSLPSGFILPLHRHLERDTNLQSSQRNYLLARPTESVAQLKSFPLSSGSASYSVPPIVERSRSTVPRHSVFSTGHQQSPWQGYVEY